MRSSISSLVKPLESYSEYPENFRRSLFDFQEFIAQRVFQRIQIELILVESRFFQFLKTGSEQF